MKTLLRNYETPPTGWRYLVHETGFTVKGQSLMCLVDNVTKHMVANRVLVPENLWDIVQDQMCQVLPASYCKEPGFPTPPEYGGTKFTLGRVIAGTRVISAWLLSGKPRVDQETADWRSAICAGCPHNRQPSGCEGCSAGRLRDLVVRVVAGSRTLKEEEIVACDVCGCSLKAKVWIPLDILQEHVERGVNGNFPAHCWAKKQ
jgi:hypothetical protein